jgi:hypothetical protein
MRGEGLINIQSHKTTRHFKNTQIAPGISASQCAKMRGEQRNQAFEYCGDAPSDDRVEKATACVMAPLHTMDTQGRRH